MVSLGLEANPSFLGPEHAGDEAEQRALARSVLADEPGPALGEHRAHGLEHGEYVMVGERHPFESNAGHGELPDSRTLTCPGRSGTRRDSGFGDYEPAVPRGAPLGNGATGESSDPIETATRGP